MYALKTESVEHWHWTDKELGSPSNPKWTGIINIDDFLFQFVYHANNTMYWCADFSTWKKYEKFQGPSYVSGYTLTGTGLFPRVAKLMEIMTRSFLIETQCNSLVVRGAEHKRIKFYREVMPTWPIEGYTTELLDRNGIKFVRKQWSQN